MSDLKEFYMSDISRFDEEYKDVVNHPDHYISDSGIETIDVIEAFTKDLEGFEAYCTGNIIKYICRWKNKNGEEDLKKARWYINKLLSYNKAEENTDSSIIDVEEKMKYIIDRARMDPKIVDFFKKVHSQK